MHLRVVALAALLSCPPVWAQTATTHAFAMGASYLRVYGGGGIALHADYQWQLAKRVAVGVPLTLAWSSVPTNPGHRRTFLIGGDVRLVTPPTSHHASPYLGLAILAISNSVPDFIQAQFSGTIPTHDFIGSQWGYGVALETGVALARTRKVGVRLDARLLYQRVYEDDAALGWMAGASIVF